MAKNYVSPGDKLNYTAPSAVTSGQGVLVGNTFGVAVYDAAISEQVTLGITGVWELTKNAGEAWTEGQLIYWDNTNKRTTSTVGTNKLIGTARFAALAAATVGTVRLNGVGTN